MINMNCGQIFRIGLAVVLPLSIAGCATKGKSGALIGGGIGALAGQAFGGNTEATLIGAAVGSGIGYIIGNEKGKEHAAELARQNKAQDYAHSEVGQLAQSRWSLISLVPKDRAKPYVSKIVEFRPNARVVTTTTMADGSVEVVNERYRVVGSTLIVNKPGYLINARFGIEGDQLIIDAEEFRAVLQRIPS